MPSHFICKPRSKAYIAPPIIVPSLLFTRYFKAIKVSAYFVAIPKMPVIHIQKTAPGPPKAIAVPTPTIFPVPIVEDNAAVKAANCDMSPESSSSLATDIFIALKISFWTNPVLIVIKICVPISNIINGHPHKRESSVCIKFPI